MPDLEVDAAVVLEVAVFAASAALASGRLVAIRFGALDDSATDEARLAAPAVLARSAVDSVFLGRVEVDARLS